MEITEIRIKLMGEQGERLKAFCSITFDNCFVIRDLKIIEGTNGPFVAMPSRKLTAHCPKCRCKNHLRAGFCNQCGTRLKGVASSSHDDGRAKLYADIAHPINSRCREKLQNSVIEAYEAEQHRSALPGYISTYDDIDRFEAIAADSERSGTSGRSIVQNAEQVQGPHRPPRDTAEKKEDASAGREESGE